jgi:hypothetical protein
MELEDQIKQLKQRAKEYCNQVDLDKAIRTLCKGESSNGDNTNRWIEISLPSGKILDLRATWGAGTNGAYARYVNQPCDLKLSPYNPYFHLYECLDYGKHLSGFQMGEWVEVVLKLAGQEALVQQAQNQVAEIKRLQAELSKWIPVE